MNYSIEKMKKSDWKEVSKIYLQGINTGIATFQNSIPNHFYYFYGYQKQKALIKK